MAPGPPRISVGIQPQIALYSVILGSVCAFGWYSEKYWRDEGDLDGQIKKLYLQDAQEAQARLPQMNAAIRGQSLDLDGRMDKMVWGGKAKLLNNSGSSNSSGGDGSNNTSETPETGRVDDNDDNTTTTTEATIGNSDEEENQKPRRRRRKKRKRKKKAESNDSNNDDDDATSKRKEAEDALEKQKQNLVLQSSIAGIAVGAVAVVAVSALLGGGAGSGGRK